MSITSNQLTNEEKYFLLKLSYIDVFHPLFLLSDK